MILGGDFRFRRNLAVELGQGFLVPKDPHITPRAGGVAPDVYLQCREARHRGDWPMQDPNNIASKEIQEPYNLNFAISASSYGMIAPAFISWNVLNMDARMRLENSQEF